jgi:hypothetical protein
MRIHPQLSVVSFAFALVCTATTPCGAALTIDFNYTGGSNNGPAPSGTFSYTLSDLDTGSPTVSGVPAAAAASASGSLSGVSGLINVLVEPGTSFTSTGSSITGITTGTLHARGGRGWSVSEGSGSQGRWDNGEIVAFTFDLSGLTLPSPPPGFEANLVLGDFEIWKATERAPAEATVNPIYIVDGVSTTPFTATNNDNFATFLLSPNTTLIDGSRIAWTKDSGDDFKIRSLTFEVVFTESTVVPEPVSVGVWLTLGFCLVGYRVRRLLRKV